MGATLTYVDNDDEQHRLEVAMVDTQPAMIATADRRIVWELRDKSGQDWLVYIDLGVDGGRSVSEIAPLFSASRFEVLSIA